MITCFPRNLGEHDSCRNRRELGRLDDRVSGCYGRYDGSPGEHVGTIPWRETGDNAERTAHTDRVRPGCIGFENLAFGEINPARNLLECRGDQILLERRNLLRIRRPKQDRGI